MKILFFTSGINTSQFLYPTLNNKHHIISIQNIPSPQCLLRHCLKANSVHVEDLCNMEKIDESS